MDIPKIQLSADEMQLVTNPQWILTKHRIIEKVYRLFGDVSDKMQLYMQANKEVLPVEILQLSPKISKGEQYESLPYVVLDYPRLFSKENVFAVRTFFWWGNYFSITLHLKGAYHHQYYKKIAAALTHKKLQDYHCSLSGSEFSFNLGGKHYFFVNDAGAEKFTALDQQPFLKISYKISFEHWSNAEQQLLETFKYLMAIVAN